jgi:predicted PurR-regulated permease PerM
MADLSKLYFISFGFALLGLTAVLMLGLLPALLAGLLVYQLVDFGAESLARYGIRRNIGRMFLLFLVSVVVVFSISLLVIMLASYVTDGPESLVVCCKKWQM